MATRIYYVAARVGDASAQYLERICGPTSKHVTLAYSREWFPYRVNEQYPIHIRPGGYLRYGSLLVLDVSHPLLINRHGRLREAGAGWGFENYTPHITLKRQFNTAPDLPTEWIKLAHEYYGTWDEEEIGE